MTAKTRSAIAWVYLAPSLIMMFLVGVIPLAMVFFYSVNDTFAGNNFIFVGAKWFEQVLTSPEFHAAFLRSLGFTLMVLMVEIPLGIFIALRMPARGWLTGTYVVLMALPLLMPSLVVGYLWQILALADAGLLGAGAARLGLTWDMNSVAVTWATLVLMDVWHWTGFVVLLCFAGLRAIPDACYQAAQIDGARPWAVFRFVQLPRLKLVLLVALLLRFIDSLVIYTEAYVVSRGGPGVSTTFLSHELVQTATIQFDLGEGGAMAVIYFLIVLCVAWAFFNLIVARDRANGART